MARKRKKLKLTQLEEKLNKGKEIFEKILYDNIYSHEKKKVKDFITNNGYEDDWR